LEPATRVAAIQQALTSALQPVAIEVNDESHLHRGHAGAQTGKGHFRVRIVSAAFESKSAVVRHRLIYTALADLMATDIHALSIDAQSPDEAAR
jgi:BolA family transcriptional regulator, general stress-responsive regulator